MRSAPRPETRETLAHIRALHLGPSSSCRTQWRSVGCHPNARVARAFATVSLLETREALAQFRAVHWEKRAPRERACQMLPATNRVGSPDCDWPSIRKRARPPRIFGPFSGADRVPQAGLADRLTALYKESLSLVYWAMNRKRARAARVSNVPTVVLCSSRSPASRSLLGAKCARVSRVFPLSPSTARHVSTCSCAPVCTSWP